MVEYTYNLNSIYKSLADPTRRDILERVCQRQHTISELAAEYQMSFAGVAKHINVLEQAELITKHRQGKEQLIDVRADAFIQASVHLARYKHILSQRYNLLEQLLQED